MPLGLSIPQRSLPKPGLISLSQSEPSSQSEPELVASSGPLPVTGRLGGVDFGTVRIGLATCDPSRQWVTPYETYQRRNERLDAKYFCEMSREESLVGWVIGLPIHCDGKESQKSAEVRAFANWLTQTTSLPHVLYDERFTSREARRLLQGSEMSSKKKKMRIDRIAAHLILTHYLDSRSNWEGISQSQSNSRALDDGGPT